MISKEQYSKSASLAGRLNSDSQWVFDPKLQQTRPGKGWWEAEGADRLAYVRGAQKPQQERVRASGGTGRLNDEGLIQRQRRNKARLTDNLFN